MKPKPATMAMRKQAATRRSALLARSRSGTSAGSSRGEAEDPPESGPSSVLDGGGVPITRYGTAGPSWARGSAPAWPAGPPGRASSGTPPAVVSLMSPPMLRGNPHRRQHHEQQQAEERNQALGDRPDAAEAEAAGGRLGSLPGDVRA